MDNIKYDVQMSSFKLDDIISYDTVEVHFILTIRETIERFEFVDDRGWFTVTQYNRSDNEMTSYLTFDLTDEFLSPQSNVEEKILQTLHTFEIDDQRCSDMSNQLYNFAELKVATLEDVHKNLVIFTQITRLRRVDFPDEYFDDEEEDEGELEQAVTQSSIDPLELAVSASREAVEALKVEIYEGKDGDDVDDCRVCFDDFIVGSEVMRMPCGHLFHRDCILKWLEKSGVCPMCRLKMSG
ncbi:E3 ubiquitin-protein ligase RING1 [Acorus gramineus]|uniref:E3 ubiquitin-protein ligase RING1 n=1 Tax=Acorus gramineus TaxID=55184 RepID=A0AAV9AG94_ACOGR|nr:E3 ubiquitin-protein ligase RING1 [Acorus gramineus]